MIVLHSGNLDARDMHYHKYCSESERTNRHASDNVWRDLRKVRHNFYRHKTARCDATLIDIPQDQSFEVD